MPEAEVNLGTLNGSFEDVGYQGATESETAYIGWGGDIQLTCAKGFTSHIYFFVNFFGVVILPINPQKLTFNYRW